MQFKESRYEKELKELITKNKPLYNLLLDIDAYSTEFFKKEIVITMIFRTEAEQNYLYRNSARYKAKKFKSPHQFWHAADIRSFIYTKSQIDELVDFINDKYNDSNYYKFTADCHDVGSGMHFHIQYYKI